MSQRTERSSGSRVTSRRGTRKRLELRLERLEGRELMSYGGSPDFSFGSYGYKAYTLPSTADSLTANASATQGDGKTIVVGNIDSPGPTLGSIITSLVALRYNADGSPDTTFGIDGVFTDPSLSAPLVETSTTPNVTAEQVALQADGKIVVVGNNNGTAVAVRLTTSGSLDTSFGTGGIATLGTEQVGGTQVERAASLAILPSGGIAVGGAVYLTSGSFNPTPAVELLTSGGSPDASFGTGGLALVPLPAGDVGDDGNAFAPGYSLAAQPDGKIAILDSVASAGNTSYGSLLVTRFTATGGLDASFGTAGQATVTAEQGISTANSILGLSLAYEPDGKLVIGGSTYFPGLVTLVTAIRLNSTGALDPGFGIGGFDILGGAAYTNGAYGVKAIAFQPDGKILMAVDNSPAVIRLDTNGLPDNNFGTGGVANIPAIPGSNGGIIGQAGGTVGVSVLSDGKIMVTEGENFENSFNGLVRLLPQGSTNDFDGDGISDPAVLNVDLNIDPASVDYQPSGGGAVVNTAIGDPGAALTLSAPGAYNGGGVSEIAVYRVGKGTFDIKPYYGGADITTALGTPGIGNAYPAPGDYDFSGVTELAVYEPALAEFLYLRGFGQQPVTVPLGVPGAGQSIPAPADYFGTGQDDFAVYLVAQGAYEIQNPVTKENDTIPFGTPGAGQAIPVPGDYDGVGHAELAVYVPASGDLIYRSTKTNIDVVVSFGVAGIATTLPAVGDFDGSGHDEVAGYLPGTATFEYLPASGPVVSIPLGTANESLAYSMGTNAVAESGIGSSSPGAIGAPLEIPLTPDVLETLTGTVAKKKTGNS